MITNIESIVVSKFDGMPLWVRVTVYFSILITYVSLLVGANYIDGRLVMEIDGELTPVRGVERQIWMHRDGRTIKVKPNEDGYWALPIASKLPYQEIPITVVIAAREYPVDLTYTMILGNEVKMIYMPEAAADKRIKFASHSSRSGSGFNIISSAVAQSETRSATVKLGIIKALERTSGMREDRLDRYFREELMPSVSKTSKYLYRLERDEAIYITDEALAKVNTLDQFIQSAKRK